jgi:hypothetical protein
MTVAPAAGAAGAMIEDDGPAVAGADCVVGQ